MRWICLAICILVTGCGHYEWVSTRPGAGDFGATRYACQRDSLAVAPVATVIEVQRERDRNGRRETVTAVDANADNRSGLFESCMAAHGWQQVFVSNDAPRPVAATVPAPPQAPPQPPPAPRPSTSRAVGSLPPPPSLSADNLHSFRDYLANANLHKAFAVSRGGAFGWQSRLASRQDAADAALSRCAQYAEDCRVYAVDNELYSGD